MPRKPSPSINPATIALQRRIHEWRRSRQKRSRMPEELWVAAAGLARTQGVNPVARALGLDYYNLKARLEVPRARENVPQFVELTVPGFLGDTGAVLEIRRPDGANLKLEAVRSPDLIRELILVFLGQQ